MLNSRIHHYTPPVKIPPPYCDYISTGDNEIADRNLGYGWENPGSMNTSYGYNKNDHQWLSTGTIITNLVDTVSKGGNYLLNVGPTGKLTLGELNQTALQGRHVESVSMLGSEGRIDWNTTPSGLQLSMPERPASEHVWIYRIQLKPTKMD